MGRKERKEKRREEKRREEKRREEKRDKLLIVVVTSQEELFSV
jgi:hypothetical protein